MYIILLYVHQVGRYRLDLWPVSMDHANRSNVSAVFNITSLSIDEYYKTLYNEIPDKTRNIVCFLFFFFIFQERPTYNNNIFSIIILNYY